MMKGGSESAPMVPVVVPIRSPFLRFKIKRSFSDNFPLEMRTQSIQRRGQAVNSHTPHQRRSLKIDSINLNRQLIRRPPRSLRSPPRRAWMQRTSHRSHFEGDLVIW